MKSVYRTKVPKEMMASPVDKDAWYEWKLIPWPLTTEDYKKVEATFKVKFPDNFIEWDTSIHRPLPPMRENQSDR